MDRLRLMRGRLSYILLFVADLKYFYWAWNRKESYSLIIFIRNKCSLCCIPIVKTQRSELSWQQQDSRGGHQWRRYFMHVYIEVLIGSASTLLTTGRKMAWRMWSFCHTLHISHRRSIDCILHCIRFGSSSAFLVVLVLPLVWDDRNSYQYLWIMNTS